jgi:hypothetical protein
MLSQSEFFAISCGEMSHLVMGVGAENVINGCIQFELSPVMFPVQV